MAAGHFVLKTSPQYYTVTVEWFLHFLQGKERKIRKEEIDEALAKNKRRMLGIIKFLGELFKLKVC